MFFLLLHLSNLYFRDLKPENILIDVNGHIKLCDFGFAVVLANSRGTLSDGCGSAMYVAPGNLIMPSCYNLVSLFLPRKYVRMNVFLIKFSFLYWYVGE